MQDTLVSARMPAVKKDRAREVLESIGATTSDLINSAFDFVIEAKKLPSAPVREQRSEEDLMQFVAGTSFEIDWLKGAVDYKEQARQMRLADYESLA